MDVSIGQIDEISSVRQHVLLENHSHIEGAKALIEVEGSCCNAFVDNLCGPVEDKYVKRLERQSEERQSLVIKDGLREIIGLKLCEGGISVNS